MYCLALLFALGAGVAPTFEAYPARAEAIAQPKLDLRSHPIGRKYRALLREAVAEGVSAAGHFAVAHWGCGTNCSQFALVELHSGTVYHNPHRILTRGLEYRPHSRLVVLNPWREDFTDFPQIPTQYCIVGRGGKLRVIKTVRHDH